MKSPDAHVAGNQAGAAVPPAFRDSLLILSKRSEFLRTAKAYHQAMPGFVLQGRRRSFEETTTDAFRVGFTCSKKVGNAVARNRAKRRLRAIARATLPTSGQSGWDYVLIGRAGHTADMPFCDLNRDLKIALGKLHQKAP